MKSSKQSSRTLIERNPNWDLPQGAWPGRWVRCSHGDVASFVAAYKLEVSLDKALTARIHVSADQRYELFLNGERIGRGSERGDAANWFYETYDLNFDVGDHVLVARVWTLDSKLAHAPAAQISTRHGFLLVAEAPHTAQLSTGLAPWQTQLLGGYTFAPSPFPGAGELAGGTLHLDGADYPWNCERGAGNSWQPAEAFAKPRDSVRGSLDWGSLEEPILRPALLPPMFDQICNSGTLRHVDEPQGATEKFAVVIAQNLASETDNWQAWLTGNRPLGVPAHTRRRVIIDLNEYVCAYPALTVSGGRGSQVRLRWAESLYQDEKGRDKGNRDEIEGRFFIGRGDSFAPDGGDNRTFEILWWNCGRYLELLVETADEPLELQQLTLRETRYPLVMESEIELSEPKFNRVVPLMWRTLQMCAHETYMDCPYYEQLMYTGDTRLEILTTYATTRDDRLPRKALQLFAASQSFEGLTQSRYPCSSPQIIPQFSLFWVAMLHDFMLWRDDLPFVRALMPRARTIIESFLARICDEGLCQWPSGWDWVDWPDEWSKQRGTAPNDGSGWSAINQWQLVMVLGMATDIESALGETALAARLENARHALAARTTEVFWDEQRGLFADTPSKSAFSEHAQCYAILSGLVDEEKTRRIAENLINPPYDIVRATIYFQFYLFETLRQIGRTDVLLQRLKLWYDLPDLGLRTAIESPEPSRSDCHAWSAHPLYHAFASVVGIRPAEAGFKKVIIEPQLGTLQSARASMVHPSGGFIEAQLTREGDHIRGTISLPNHFEGELIANGQRQPLQSGKQPIEFR